MLWVAIRAEYRNARVAPEAAIPGASPNLTFALRLVDPKLTFWDSADQGHV
jgi:hypothetical protein